MLEKIYQKFVVTGRSLVMRDGVRITSGRIRRESWLSLGRCVLPEAFFCACLEGRLVTFIRIFLMVREDSSRGSPESPLGSMDGEKFRLPRSF